jgi:hypothetical protein
VNRARVDPFLVVPQLHREGDVIKIQVTYLLHVNWSAFEMVTFGPAVPASVSFSHLPLAGYSLCWRGKCEQGQHCCLFGWAAVSVGGLDVSTVCWR